jgi:hypothetical protein
MLSDPWGMHTWRAWRTPQCTGIVHLFIGIRRHTTSYEIIFISLGSIHVIYREYWGCRLFHSETCYTRRLDLPLSACTPDALKGIRLNIGAEAITCFHNQWRSPRWRSFRYSRNKLEDDWDSLVWGSYVEACLIVLVLVPVQVLVSCHATSLAIYN